MSTFDSREQAFEAKFAHDEEMQFKAQARCNKLLGLWAAEMLGKSGDAAEAYAKTVVTADFQEPGHEDVVRCERHRERQQRTGRGCTLRMSATRS